MKTLNCPLCGEQSKCTYNNLKGYRENTSYDIYECIVCEASFSDPLVSDPTIYNAIYSQAASIPGYERYIRYSKLVKKMKHPLDTLANAENAYWAVREALTINFPNKKNVSIIEIGSGLGYLTYSLNKEGYTSKGIDLSDEAVSKARARYGDYYEAGNLFLLADKYKENFDCVIMTELIEHVEDPKAFIEASLSMLKKGGKLIITTPNKSWAPKGSLWGSDAPSIHLWWFAEKSIVMLAESFNRKCSFIDFTGFSSKFHEPLWSPSIDDIQAGVPKISTTGEYIGTEKVKNLKSNLLGIKVRYYLSFLRRRLKSKNKSSRASTLCAVIS